MLLGSSHGRSNLSTKLWTSTRAQAIAEGSMVRKQTNGQSSLHVWVYSICVHTKRKEVQGRSEGLERHICRIYGFAKDIPGIRSSEKENNESHCSDFR